MTFSAAAISIDKIRFDDRGLVPAIAQDYLDGTVLMMAWMNAESLQKNDGFGRGVVLEPIAPRAMAQRRHLWPYPKGA